jgi:hypothetical protein
VESIRNQQSRVKMIQGGCQDDITETSAPEQTKTDFFRNYSLIITAAVFFGDLKGFLVL